MRLILKALCFAVLWFFAVGPALWYGWLYFGPDVDTTPREGSIEDLGQDDFWRQGRKW